MLAEEAEAQFFRDRPEETLTATGCEQVFDAIASTQAGRSLFDERHNPLCQIPLSHDAAKELIGFWRRRGETGGLVHDFTDPEWDTRFLGDLYQDLSEARRRPYALLQTPEFVEEFILDRTLDPAIDEFGLRRRQGDRPDLRLGPLPARRLRPAAQALGASASPARDPRELVRRALDAVAGVDINPFAVAIARFRLLVAALAPAASRRSPTRRTFPMHLAVGDSLLHGDAQLDARRIGDDDDCAERSRYATEDVRRAPPASSSAAATTSWSATRPTSPSRTRRSTSSTASATTPAPASTRCGAVHGALLRSSPSRRRATATAPATSGRSPPTRS